MENWSGVLEIKMAGAMDWICHSYEVELPYPGSKDGEQMKPWATVVARRWCHPYCRTHLPLEIAEAPMGTSRQGAHTD
jgi:hypothetical protein